MGVTAAHGYCFLLFVCDLDRTDLFHHHHLTNWEMRQEVSIKEWLEKELGGPACLPPPLGSGWELQNL